MSGPTRDSQDHYNELASEYLQRPGVTIGRALQNDVLKVDGKIFAFLRSTRLVVKLPAKQAATLVAEGRAIPFESGGRTMKEWVAVEPPGGPGGDSWRRFMSDAIDYVGRGS
ncbi:MAG TPA: hypothetical protein VGS60_06425 [Actinomycetes bacterium]|jgi:hypothetical protein|nr:hypothetical protein [Actinomycetes bacterium]